jgi:hypothetical protein
MDRSVLRVPVVNNVEQDLVHMTLVNVSLCLSTAIAVLLPTLAMPAHTATLPTALVPTTGAVSARMEVPMHPAAMPNLRQTVFAVQATIRALLVISMI